MFLRGFASIKDPIFSNLSGITIRFKIANYSELLISLFRDTGYLI